MSAVLDRPTRAGFKDLKNLVERRIPFKLADVFSVGNADYYVVYSFGTHHPILVFLDGIWYANSAPAAATTHRHQLLCQPEGHTVPYRSMGVMRGLAAAALRHLPSTN